MNTPRTFTQDQKHDAAVRELRMRERVYGRLVASGKMSRADADREIGVMRAIADDYRPRDLFDGDAA